MDGRSLNAKLQPVDLYLVTIKSHRQTVVVTLEIKVLDTAVLRLANIDHVITFPLKPPKRSKC